jgi:hypothetical protein
MSRSEQLFTKRVACYHPGRWDAHKRQASPGDPFSVLVGNTYTSILLKGRTIPKPSVRFVVFWEVHTRAAAMSLSLLERDPLVLWN